MKKLKKFTITRLLFLLIILAFLPLFAGRETADTLIFSVQILFIWSYGRAVYMYNSRSGEYNRTLVLDRPSETSSVKKMLRIECQRGWSFYEIGWIGLTSQYLRLQWGTVIIGIRYYHRTVLFSAFLKVGERNRCVSYHLRPERHLMSIDISIYSKITDNLSLNQFQSVYSKGRDYIQKIVLYNRALSIEQ